MISGVVNVYKQQGFTSFDVVAKMRGIFKQKEIGHTGTLDPMAEGVLVVCLGKATKLAELISTSSKEYRAVLRLGNETDTDDITGKILKEHAVDVTEEEVREAVMSFVGPQMQVPPIYAAIKKDGKKLYEYARAGIEITPDPREINVFSIEIESVELPEVTFHVSCSKGTYIRSLCRDIGRKLGTYGTMAALTRTSVNSYTEQDAYKLEDLQSLKDEDRLYEAVQDMDTLLTGVPGAVVEPKAVKLIYNGNKLLSEDLTFTDSTEEECRKADYFKVYDGDRLYALYRFNKDTGEYRCFKMVGNAG